jgi:O-antigen/teichoic acid export membrane protein
MAETASLSSAVRWSFVMDGGRQAITTLTTLVLAALLGPEAFGLIAMALVYVSLLELLLKQGMGAAIVQREELRRSHLDTAFWLVVAAAAVLTAVGVILSGPWAAANRTPELRPVVIALTALVPLHALMVVQEAVLRRGMRFRLLALRSNASVLVGGVVGIALAVSGAGVWALVAQQLTAGAVGVLVLWTVSSWRPRPTFSRQAASDLLRFSSGSLLGSLGVFVVNRADALLIGLFFGPAVVGLYRLASRLIEAVVGATVSALMSVSLPELSRVQRDPARFTEGVLRFTWMSAVLTLPVLGALAGASDAVLRLIGVEWAPAAPALRLLCIAGAVRALFAFTGPMLQALGRPFEQAAIAWLVGLLGSLGFVVAGVLVRGASTTSQLRGLALSQALLYGLVFGAICLWLLRRRAGVHPVAVFSVTAPAGLAGVLGFSVAFLLWQLPSVRALSPLAAVSAVCLPAAGSSLGVLMTVDRRARSIVVTSTGRLRAWRKHAVAPSAEATDGRAGHDPLARDADGAADTRPHRL